MSTAIRQPQVKRLTFVRGNGDRVEIPYWELDSGRSGPRLLITAALHGNEVQGSEGLRRFMRKAPGALRRGSLVAAPLANLLAVRERRPHFDAKFGDPPGRWDINLNCVWPGRENGTDVERLAFALHEAWVKDATHGLDLHTWNRFWAATALPSAVHPLSLEMARVSAMRFINPRPAPDLKAAPTPCTLGALFNTTGRAALSIEFSGQYAVIEAQAAAAERAITNITRYLGLCEGDPEGLDEPCIRMDQAKRIEVRAPHSGLFLDARWRPGDPVPAADVTLGWLFSDTDLTTVPVQAPRAGWLYAYGCHRKTCDVDLAAMHPYADAGDMLAIIMAP